jgi:hypothetical protein
MGFCGVLDIEKIASGFAVRAENGSLASLEAANHAWDESREIEIVRTEEVSAACYGDRKSVHLSKALGSDQVAQQEFS